MMKSLYSRLWAFLILDGFLWDWLVVLAALLINFLVPLSKHVQPIERFYTTTDATLDYPVHSDTIPGYALVLLFIVFPFVFYSVVCLITRNFPDWHAAILSTGEGLALTSGFKQWITLTGVLRPDWLQTLQTGNESDIKDGHRAYPSGHASYMFFAMTIMCLYLVGKFKIFAYSSHGHFFKVVIASMPLWLAAFVAVSRITDYRHSPAQVNAGVFVGFMCGAFAYFLNYPSLFSPDCHLPRTRVRKLFPSSEDEASGLPISQKAYASGHTAPVHNPEGVAIMNNMPGP